jgi:outer membrane immunogenic protein
MKQLRHVIFLALIIALPWALHAQAISMNGVYGDVPRIEFGANYNYFHANAPPGQCGCFMMNGGSGTFTYNVTDKWAAVADMTLGHANNVDNSGQNITIFDYLFGGRYTRRNHGRYAFYGQGMMGGAKEDVNFDFTINRQALSFLGGGGVTTRLNPKFGLTLGEVDWIYSRIPNAINDRQNDLRVVVGVTYNIHPVF